MPITRDATLIWKKLNGILCIFKPTDLYSLQLQRNIVGRISRDLCELDVRPPVNHVLIESAATHNLIGENSELSVKVIPSYADQINVVGPRYLPKDIKCNIVSSLGEHTSGVMLLGINEGVQQSMQLFYEKLIRVFHVKARLGRETDSGWIDRGKTYMKANFMHVPREAIERVLAATQASHQRKAFDLLGVDAQSQAAYEMAIQGPIKPSGKTGPIIYGARCISFNPPDFTMEIHSIGETEEYLLQLTGEVGRRVRSAASCVGIRCIRHGPFTTDLALARTQWRLDHFVENLMLCQQVFEQRHQREQLQQ